MSKQEFEKLRIDIWVSGAADSEGNGGFSYLMQSMIQNREYSKLGGGYAKETTITRMTLKSIVEALKLIKKRSIIHIYTTNAQTSSGINKYMYQWSKREWKTLKGEDIAHNDLWKEIYDLLEEKSLGHKVHFQKASLNQDNNTRVVHRSSQYVQRARKQVMEVLCP